LHLTPLAVLILEAEGEEKDETQLTARPTIRLTANYLKCTRAVFSNHEINDVCPHWPIPWSLFLMKHINLPVQTC